MDRTAPAPRQAKANSGGGSNVKSRRAQTRLRTHGLPRICVDMFYMRLHTVFIKGEFRGVISLWDQGCGKRVSLMGGSFDEALAAFTLRAIVAPQLLLMLLRRTATAREGLTPHCPMP